MSPDAAPTRPAPTGLPLEPIPTPRLAAWAEELGLTLSPEALAGLGAFGGWLRKATQAVNLTAITDPAEIELKHLADSLTLLPLIHQWRLMDDVADDAPTRVVDVGTGGGVPGIPLALADDRLRVTLVESVGKKGALLREAVAALGLSSRVTVEHARAEDLGRLSHHRHRHDVAVARAVAALPLLTEWLHPLVRVGGALLCPQGERQATEAESAGELIARHFPGTAMSLAPVGLEALPGRVVAVMLKSKGTPPEFPRPAAEAAKRPLK